MIGESTLGCGTYFNSKTYLSIPIEPVNKTLSSTKNEVLVYYCNTGLTMDPNI